MNGLDRLLRPRNVAVIGGGTWGAKTIDACRSIGFEGGIWPVHPTRTDVAGIPAFAALEDLPDPPDAAFVGVNRETTIDIVRALSAQGAGGAVCFASGFLESESETGDGGSLQSRVVEAAGNMPVLGPNCYGFINALDGAALWPDQFGLTRVESGVALITQSSNIALNVTMQNRGVPLAYVVTVGNQAQSDLAQIGRALLEDPRVTALGLHIEGIRDIRNFEAMAASARQLGKRIVVLKVGASEQAQAATISHTASLAGSDAGARALLKRLGMARVEGLADLLETLKILHVVGPLPSARIASLSCSGGEVGLIADAASGQAVTFPPLTDAKRVALQAVLGPRIALSNPLDYQTFIWGDKPAMERVFCAMCDADLALCCVVLDFPRIDRCEPAEWDDVVAAVVSAKARTGTPFAIISSLPENLPEETALGLIKQGIVPLNGIGEGVNAIAAAAEAGSLSTDAAPVLLPGTSAGIRTLSEFEAKTMLASYGLETPSSGVAKSPDEAACIAQALQFPVVVKGQGTAHKTDAGLVALSVCSAEEVRRVVKAMDAETFLVEEMVRGTIVELLVGVVRDPVHGFVLTIGAGGTHTELLQDTATLLLPVSRGDIIDALESLRLAPLLTGYRGKPAINQDALVRAIKSIEAFVTEHAATVVEVEVNPLICTENRVTAADALIRMGEIK